MASPLKSSTSVGAEYVIVLVADHQYAIDIMSVREIRGWTESTPLPNAPANFLGMINLRGAILPVMDLGSTLGLDRSRVGPSSVVIVVQAGERQIGLLVDAVCDIMLAAEGMVQPPPDVGVRRVRDLVQGVMTTDQGIISLLSLDGVLPADCLVDIAAA